MADKNGCLQQRRDALFANTPLSGTGTCPFKGPDIAIVPMRYALDRSRYDIDPAQLTPLSKEGQWEYFAPLQSRTYTLRQLRDGFVYVYDENAEALHEYRFSAHDANLTRITWDADAGADVRSSEAESRSHLLYPRTHKLRLAFSPYQWTWRMCQQMTSSGTRRAAWMRELDLFTYSQQMKARHALPLTRLSNKVVADVDPYPVQHDGRFADSAHPPVADEEGKYPCVPLAADVVWIGSVEDKSSAVLIALDDPLAMLKDLGMQLTGDQAALYEFQIEHEHALNIAAVVEKLCGVGGDKTLLPASVRDDELKSRHYIREIEAYFEQVQVEDDAAEGQDSLTYGLAERPSQMLGEELKAKYGGLPDLALRTSWQDRSKWRREVDLDAARDYSDIQRTYLKKLKGRIAETQHDIKTIGEYIGTDPMRVFIDTTNVTSLHCLLHITADLLCNLSQDLRYSSWLKKEEEKSKTLLGLTRFGFSSSLKEAMTQEANRLMQGISDTTAMAGRAGELNSFLNHDVLAAKPWMKALSEPVRLTLDALVALAKGAGKAALENIQLAFLPVDSRLVNGAVGDNAALMLRNLLMGQVLLSHPQQLQIDADFANRHAAWKADVSRLRNLYETAQYRWLYQARQYDRRAMTSLMQDLQRDLKLRMLSEPLLFDYRSQRYAAALQSKIATFFAQHGQLTTAWSKQAKAWSAGHGVNAAAITWGIAVVNLMNTFVTYETASRDGELSKKDLAKVASAAAYTGNALMAVFVETGWGAMKDLGDFDERGNYTKITQKTAAQWQRLGRPEFGKLIKGFGPRLVGLGAFAVVAGALELWDVLDDRESASGVESSLLLTKAWAVSGMILLGGAQVLAGALAVAGNSRLISYVMNPWLLGTTVVIGLIYLFATFALNYLKRDAVGKWLHKCLWSRFPTERFENSDEENLSFQEIQLSPAVFVNPTMKTMFVNVGDLGYQLREVPSGVWLQLRIPAALRGEALQVNLATSYRPSRLMPVTLLSGSLQNDFIESGSPEPVSQWGNIPERKSPAVYDVPSCKALPEPDEDVVWQTWMPVDERTRYLEVQVWYPQEIIAARSNDKGYRFQVELAVGGTRDTNDSGLMGSANRSLPIDKLGGRADAVILPVPL